MHMDARNLIRECNDCQVHRPVPRNPQQNLTPITSPWPFYKWGIDIAGPFPEGPGKVKFLIVAIDYFTKWIEAKAVATITGNQVKKFVWDNIVCRFGLPGEIISDNGKQFRDNPFKDWCEKLCIRQHFASVKHPQANGLVERANRSLGEGIKARLDERSRDWIEELPHVLWAHRTMIKSSNGETPFSLTYGTEAVIPAEIGMPTLRTAEVDQAKNNEALGINLDLIEEKREQENSDVECINLGELLLHSLTGVYRKTLVLEQLHSMSIKSFGKYGKVKEGLKRTLAKKSTKAPVRGGVIRETPEIPLSKKKEKVDVTRGKGIELLSQVALNEDAQFEEVRMKSMRDFHKTHPIGSGTITKTAPSAAKVKPFVTSEGTGVTKGF
ncbi:reverse transcriptase domain-containing protein [Tanacetum coccineum]